MDLDRITPARSAADRAEARQAAMEHIADRGAEAAWGGALASITMLLDDGAQRYAEETGTPRRMYYRGFNAALFTIGTIIKTCIAEQRQPSSDAKTDIKDFDRKVEELTAEGEPWEDMRDSIKKANRRLRHESRAHRN